MTDEIKLANLRLQEIKKRLALGANYEECKILAQPYFEILNKRGAFIAKKYKTTFRPISFSNFMR